MEVISGMRYLHLAGANEAHHHADGFFAPKANFDCLGRVTPHALRDLIRQLACFDLWGVVKIPFLSRAAGINSL